MNKNMFLTQGSYVVTAKLDLLIDLNEPANFAACRLVSQATGILDQTTVGNVSRSALSLAAPVQVPAVGDYVSVECQVGVPARGAAFNFQIYAIQTSQLTIE
jgi:hypothetical protein